VAQLTSLERTPALETPSYDVLQRRASYEIRRYAPFLVASAAMPAAAGAAGDGGGFGTLARCVHTHACTYHISSHLHLTSFAPHLHLMCTFFLFAAATFSGATKRAHRCK
jgi:hypothetical protein